jgi:hypothetical protein
MESNLKIDYEFISTWHPKYDQIANDETAYRNLVALVKKEIEQKSTLSKETFINILHWKSPRVKGIVRLNEFYIYEKGIADAYNAEEEQKLRILLRLYGIGTPVGSTILHFMYPDSFPIIDIRTAETLHYAGRIESSLTDFVHYTPFRAEILKIERENPGFSLREIDRALFAYHKIYLSAKLKENTKKKRDCLNFIIKGGYMESLHEFTVRFSKDVGCYYHSTTKVPLYSLKKYDTDERGKMGVFGWVNELKRINSFRIDTYWYLAYMVGVAELADGIKEGMHYVSKKNDPEGKGTGIFIYVRNGSSGEDYQKAIKVLKAVKDKL